MERNRSFELVMRYLNSAIIIQFWSQEVKQQKAKKKTGSTNEGAGRMGIASIIITYYFACAQHTSFFESSNNICNHVRLLVCPTFFFIIRKIFLLQKKQKKNIAHCEFRCAMEWNKNQSYYKTNRYGQHILLMKKSGIFKSQKMHPHCKPFVSGRASWTRCR